MPKLRAVASGAASLIGAAWPDPRGHRHRNLDPDRRSVCLPLQPTEQRKEPIMTAQENKA
jgi:hypothetical protein